MNQERQMSIRKVAVLTSLALFTASPIVALADGKGRAADACIQAFIDSHVPKGRAVRVRKEGPPASSLYPHVRHYTVSLSARVSGSRAELATARCVANSNGEVVALDSM
jgi:hypothetical protein